MSFNNFYSLHKVLSYNALLNFIIGERGVGKSYAAKKFVASHFLKKNKQFVYIRRYKTELKNALLRHSSPCFFSQIENDPTFINHKFSNSSDTFYINKNIAGFAIPLSTANILKSASFENVDTIIFDEFIIDKGNYHYLQNEVIQFLDIIETVARLRNIRVFLLGNAISINNPYFNFFNLSLPYGSDIKTFNHGLILVNYIKNIPYREFKKSTPFGKLIANTTYGKYAIDNEFLRDSKSFIKKKSSHAKFFFTCILNDSYFGVWNDTFNAAIYISHDYDPNASITYTINPDDHNETTILIRARTSPCFKAVIDYFKAGRLFFESQKIKSAFINYIIKFL